MKIKRTIITLLATLLVMISSLTAFAAGNTISFTVGASASTVKPGDTVSVTVSISESTGYILAKANVNYNTKALTFVDYTVDSTLSADKNVYVSVVNKDGYVAVTVNAKDNKTKIASTGAIAVINFKVVDGFDGETTVSVTSKKSYIATKDETGKMVNDFTVSGGSTTIKSVASGHVHTYGELIAEVPATCEATGKAAYYKCSVCDKLFDKDKKETTEEALVIKAKGHTEVVDPAVAATCETAGKTEGKHCSVCKKVLVAQKEVPAKGHTYGTLVAEVPATCEATGKAAYYKCSVCDKLFDKDKKETTEEALVIKAKGHTEVVDPAVAATCETAGKTEGKHCSVCKKVLVAQKEVPAKGHTIVKDPAVEESCTTDGKTAGSHCSVCKKVIVAQKRIPATGHNPGPEATCTEPQKCKTCGKNLGQAKGHIPGAAATCTEGQKCTVCGKEIAPAKGHTYGPGARCTEAQKCVVCGAELAPMKSHTPGAAATCTEAQKCTVCGTELAPAKGHTPGAAATCVKAQKCTVCGAEIAPATGKHTPGAAATCTEAQKCTVCGKELAPAKGHTPVVDAEVKPTLSKEGKTEGSHCSVCGEVIIAQQVIAKKSALWIYITVGVVVVIGAAVVVAVVVAKKRKYN